MSFPSFPILYISLYIPFLLALLPLSFSCIFFASCFRSSFTPFIFFLLYKSKHARNNICCYGTISCTSFLPSFASWTCSFHSLSLSLSLLSFLSFSMSENRLLVLSCASSFPSFLTRKMEQEKERNGRVKESKLCEYTKYDDIRFPQRIVSFPFDCLTPLSFSFLSLVLMERKVVNQNLNAFAGFFSLLKAFISSQRYRFILQFFSLLLLFSLITSFSFFFFLFFSFFFFSFFSLEIQDLNSNIHIWSDGKKFSEN